MNVRILGLLLCLSAAASGTAMATDYVVNQEESVFAVLTHKAGIASTFAHNHIVFAKNVNVALSADDRPANGSFKMEFAVKDLDIDTADMQAKWFQTFSDLGILAEPFTKVSRSDHDKLVTLLQSPSQLDEKKYPSISASVNSVEKGSTKLGKREFSKTLPLVLNIHGKTVSRSIPAELSFQGNKLEAEAVGAFKFTEFGIEPFSGMLGAVRNQDEFHVYVYLKAVQR